MLTESKRLKCNRTQPCENCVKRGDAMSCSYAAPGSRKKQNSSSSSSSPDGMQDRIDRLEGLVLSLMTNGAQSAGPAAAARSLSLSASSGSMEYPHGAEIDGDPGSSQGGQYRAEGEEIESETDQVAQSLGIMKVDNNKSMYFGEAHWASILKDVCIVMSLVLSSLLNMGRSPKSRTTLQITKSSLTNKHRESRRFRLGTITPMDYNSSSVRENRPSTPNS